MPSGMTGRVSALILLFAYAILPICAAQEKPIIDKIEPPFWWAGMTSSQLQLLVHGKKINGLTPSLSYEGVTLENVAMVENPNYLFLNIKLEKDVKPGTFPIEFKDNEQNTVFSYSYQLLARDKQSKLRRGFSNKDIMYLVTPDRFANGDESNDTVQWMREKSDRTNKGGRHGGDIQGLIDHLDYIQDMGFTALWLNPLLENNMERYSYHGYATTNYYKVDERFGSNADYKRLSAEAKKRGILLVMDMIANHCGLFHWWTGDEPTSDWYNYQGSEKKPYSTHKRTTITDPYASDIDKQMHTDGWFDTIMPDLNQKNPLLANYLIQNSIWWIEYANIGGVRQDTYPYPDADFMATWSRRVMEEYPNFNIVGEEWSENPIIVSRWQAGVPNNGGIESFLPSLMDFPLQSALISSLNGEARPYSNTFNPVYEMLANDFLYSDPYNLVVFLDNHDMPRFINQVNENINLFKMGMIYLFTTRGIPQIFYGTEVLMSNTEIPRDHSLIRADMPGGWKNDSINAFTGAGLTEEQRNIKAFMRKLIHFRKNTKVLHNGKLTHFAPRNEVYVFFRHDETTTTMSIFNKNTKDKIVDLTPYSEILKKFSSAKNVLTEATYDLTEGNITLPATSAILLIMRTKD
ncbi:MAG: glycoside hydrolase family 13 protein [Calditrichia bacterium]